MENEESFICDHCAREVEEDEIADCEPDEFGYCMLCGQKIEGEK